MPRRFLLVWAVFIFAFFSASSSKLPSYILPMMPALALLIGEYGVRMTGRAVALHAMPFVLAGALLMLVAPQVVRLASDEVPAGLYQAYVPWLVAAAGALAAGAAQAAWLGTRGRPVAGLLALAVGGLAAAQLGLTGHDALAPASSSYYLAQKVRPHLKPGMPFYSVGIYEQTLPFYIKRTVTLVEVRDELAFGIDQEPAKWVPDYQTFARRWREDAEALAIMHPITLDYLRANNLPHEVIARDTRRAVVRKPASGATPGPGAPDARP